jgi:hypothetical protein
MSIGAADSPMRSRLLTHVQCVGCACVKHAQHSARQLANTLTGSAAPDRLMSECSFNFTLRCSVAAPFVPPFRSLKSALLRLFLMSHQSCWTGTATSAAAGTW